MNDGSPSLLFVPVSGAYGVGEYARLLAIAKGAEMRWPGASIQFILSRAAPYAPLAPFPATLLASSPTYHSAAVIEVIEQSRPDVVIFDNAGRTAQLLAAKRSGACVVYISARRRQRRKAFRLRWMRLIDEHWIAYPEFIAGALSVVERLKLGIMRRPVIRYLDVVLSSQRRDPRDSTLAWIGVPPGAYVLVVPGGGTGHPRADDAVSRFLGAAQGLAASGIDTVFVGSGEGAPPAAAARLWVLGSVPQADLAELMRGARLVVVNGGSTLLQALACGKACVAVPIAGDQRERIERCVRAGVAVAAALDAAGIQQSAAGLFHDEPARNSLEGRTIALGLADGIEVALRAMTAMLAAKQH